MILLSLYSVLIKYPSLSFFVALPKVYFVWFEYWYPCFCQFYSWNIFFHPFTFNLCVSLALKWVSCGRICRLLFSMQSATLYLLIRSFHLLLFKVIIDRYVFTAILNLVFQLMLCFSFVPFFFFFVFPFVVWWLVLVICLWSFLPDFYESIVLFWFMITLFFKNIDPLLYLLALDW